MKINDIKDENNQFDKAIISSINRMEKDLEYTLPKFTIFEDENKTKVKCFFYIKFVFLMNLLQNLRNILQAFIFYRLDLGYVQVNK